MPNRIIKESICTSEKIASLSDFEFRLWIGLITSVDDYGRGDARPAIIKGRVFPLRERVSVKEIDVALHGLAAKGCVSLYKVGGKPYFMFPTWTEHQRIRDCKPKYPAPEEADLADNLPQVAASCGELPPESESEYESESIRESKGRKRTAFTPPTLEEIKEICLANSIKIGEEQFFDYYSSNGWMVGKNKMRDWQAAVRSWSKRDHSFGKPKKEKPERHVSFDIEEFESRMFKILD